MRKYPKHKESGVNWLGNIPVDWEVWKIKHTSYVKGRIGWDGLRSEEFYEKEYAYLVTGTDFIGGFVNWNTCHQITKERYTQDKYIQLKENDLLITKDGTIGKTAVVKNLKGFASLNSGVFVVRPLRKYNSDFLFYILNSNIFKNFIDITTTGTTILHLYQNIFEIFAYPIPQISEQHSIVRFLDYKTGQIDRFITNRQKQIELLKEQKAGIINKAVTKGINPNAKMKDSGIEWIGEVPEHWEVMKLKFCLKSMVGGGTPSKDSPEYWNGNIPWVSPKDMKSDFIEKTEDYITEIGLKESSTILIKEPSVLIVVRSGILKHTLPVAVNKVQVTLNQDLKALVPNRRFSIEYFFELFRGVAKIILFDCTKVVATVDSIETNDLLKFLMPVPSIEEQKEILNYINNETSTIDTLISKYQKQIDLMQEYRTSLISQAVTGKIDVRDWQPKKQLN